MTAMHLDQLLLGIGDAAVSDVGGVSRMLVSGLSLDSRRVQRGDVFFALNGVRLHGIEFAADAIQRGAQVVLAESPTVETALDVPVLWIDGLRSQLSEIAARFYGRPAEALRVIGVTGTNGKTSCVQLLAQALTFLGHRTASIGTLGAGLQGALREGERTTPDAISVQQLLADFRDAGASHVAMEVSSHALEQGRVAAVEFEVAAFTNLTRDHLDYHGSMAAYGAAKAKLFASPGLQSAVVNMDDSFGAELVEKLPDGTQLLRFSMAKGEGAEIAASEIVTSTQGISFHLHTPWGSRRLDSRLLGRFNVSNLVVVAACLGALGEPFERLVAALESLQPVRGRMSRLGGTDRLPLLVVDYAHTPDALEQALTALRAHCSGRLICVFGCGGERDAGKRPLMGAIAARLADVAIVTDDNPRGEDGDAIVAQIVAGMKDSPAMAIERDRAAAIACALAIARVGDVILIAGKGHETYQEDQHGKRPFDDLAVAGAALDRMMREARA